MVCIGILVVAFVPFLWVPDPKHVWHCFSIHEFIIYDKDILLREESIGGILMSTHESDVALCGIILMVALRSSLVGHPLARTKITTKEPMIPNFRQFQQ